jgi:hypothetical protein
VPGLPQSEIARYENHHNNKTNDGKNIHVSCSSLLRDRIIFNFQVDLVLGEMTRILQIVAARGLPTSEMKSKSLIHPLIAVG